MSGTTVGRALRNRFQSIRQSEVERLDRKLRGLTDADRRSAEAIIADVVDAIACVPARTLSDGAPVRSLEALVQLFDLRTDPAIGPR